MLGVIFIFRRISLSLNFNSPKTYKPNFLSNKCSFNIGLEQNNGGCGITVITSGCGPGKEGSTPSFRFSINSDKFIMEENF